MVNKIVFFFLIYFLRFGDVVVPCQPVVLLCIPPAVVWYLILSPAPLNFMFMFLI